MPNLYSHPRYEVQFPLKSQCLHFYLCHNLISYLNNFITVILGEVRVEVRLVSLNGGAQ